MLRAAGVGGLQVQYLEAAVQQICGPVPLKFFAPEVWHSQRVFLRAEPMQNLGSVAKAIVERVTQLLSEEGGSATLGALRAAIPWDNSRQRTQGNLSGVLN